MTLDGLILIALIMMGFIAHPVIGLLMLAVFVAVVWFAYFVATGRFY